MNVLADPHFLAFLGGLALGLLIALAGWRRRRALSRENDRLREHLNTQMSIHQKGHQGLLSEIEHFKKQNENLRISLAVLKNRPDRAELRALYAYDHAIRRMAERAPGFAPVWEAALKEAEERMAQTDTGLVAWVRRIVRPSLQFSHRDTLPEGGAPKGTLDHAPLDESDAHG